MNCLIIDDSGVMRRIHKNVLTEHNVPEAGLFEAEDGAEALEIAEKVPIGLFLVDWNMPKLDGLSLVRALRGTEKYKDTPVIMITSEAARYNVVDAIKAGVSDYIVKPIKGEIIWDKIKRYVEVG